MPAPRLLTGRLGRTPISSVAVLLVAAMVTACSNVPTPIPSSASIPSAAPVTGAPVTSSPAATGSATPATPALSTPSAASPDPNIGAAIDALAHTTSYRLLLVTRQGRTIDALEVLTINRPLARWRASLESTSGIVRAVVIGDRGWIDRGSGKFAQASVPDAERSVGVDGVDDILATFRDPRLAGALRFIGREDHGGASTDHYRATADALRVIRPNVGATATLDVWIAPDGHLVAISSAGSPGPGDGVQIEISAVDDPANAVEPPR